MQAHAALLIPMLLPYQPTSDRRASVCMCANDSDDDGGLHALLLQRAVQTVCFNARGCRDPPTAQWLAARSGVPEQLHGLDGLADWRHFILDLLGSPTEQIKVESVLKKHRGLSTNNPYLQPRRMTYSYELKPSDIAERVMQAACLLASEWVEDLDLIAEAEEAAVWRKRRAKVVRSDEEVKATMPAFSIDQDNNADSPFRGGNYDLLCALSTRQAVKCALASLRAQPGSWEAHEMLRKHCAESGALFGSQGAPPCAIDLPQKAADEWLSALLDLPIVLRTPSATSQGGGESSGKGLPLSPVIVDPSAVCEQVLEWRASVARAWQQQLALLPEEILSIKREYLARSTTQAIVELERENDEPK